MPAIRIEKAGLRKLMTLIYDTVQNLAVGSSSSDVWGLIEAVKDVERDYGRTLYSAGDLVPAVNITAGTYEIRQIRSGFDTQIVAPSAASKALGRVFCTYSFPDADWDSGDIFYIIFDGQEISGDPQPIRIVWGRIVTEFDALVVCNNIYDIVSHLTYGNAALKALIDDVATQVSVDAIDAAVVVVDGVADSVLTMLTDVHDTDLPAVNTNVSGVGTTASAINTIVSHASYGNAALKTLIDGIKAKTDLIPAQPAAIGSAMTLATDAVSAAAVSAAAVTKIQSGLATAASIAALNNLSSAQVETAVLSRLNLAVDGSNPPTAKSLRDVLNKDTNYTFSKTTDSLEAIRDRIEELYNNSDYSLLNLLNNVRPYSTYYGSVTCNSSGATLFDQTGDATHTRKVTGWLDLTPLTGSDSVEVKLQMNSYSGGPLVTISQTTFTAPDGALLIPVPALLPVGGATFKCLLKDIEFMYRFVISIKKLAGTDRTIYYNLIDRKYA